MLSSMPDWLLHGLPAAVVAFFVFWFGACMGSFINVLSYRLPLGMSVVSPPSRCPTCGARLKWYDNIPVLGWFLIGGRCRTCLSRVSPEYPIVEVLTGIMLAALYLALFASGKHDALWGIGKGWWSSRGMVATLPSFAAIAGLISMLIAATIIDARTFTIPLRLTLWATIFAMAAWFAQPMFVKGGSAEWPIGLVGWRGLLSAGGGLLGMGITLAALRLGLQRPSFADYHEYEQEGSPIAPYPHARREMGREAIFLAPIAVGLTAGALIGHSVSWTAPPLVWASLGASVMGYFVGAGIVWGVRIGGSLGVGREAMGLGDVHLMGAVGAALGWLDATVAFFIAPFVALSWIAVSSVSVGKGRIRRELPYGPHLAVASLLVIFARPWITLAGRALFPGLSTPPAAREDWVGAMLNVLESLASNGSAC